MGSIAIVGLPHEADVPLPDTTARRLLEAGRVIVPVDEGATARALTAAGVEAYCSLADIGLSTDLPIDRIVDGLLGLAKETDVVYATAGYPFLREGLLAGLLTRSRGPVDIFPALSPLQVILMAFDIDLTADLDIVDVQSLDPQIGQRDSHLIVTGVRNPVLARKASQRLSAVYPADHAVILADAREDLFRLSLHTVVSLAEAETGEDAAVYVSPSRLGTPVGFDELVRLISVLRGPEGCPWDRAQNHMSLRRHMLEEAYEAVDAIESGDPGELAEELGDVLLQVVLHSQIAADDGDFTVEDVVAHIVDKIRRRHPHVFADATAETPAQGLARWDAIKAGEKKRESLLDGIPHALPALVRAEKISRRVVGVGFEWETVDDVWTKFHEEVEELRAAEPGSPNAAEEIGDLLFTLVNIARKHGIDAEEALRGTCDKFVRRWKDMEGSAAEQGSDIADLDLDAMEQLWQQAKEKETN